VDLVLARNAAGKAGNQSPIGHAVKHRQLFGQAQRLVQWQEIAVNQQFEPFCALRRRGRQQVRRVHQAIGRAVVLVEPDAVIPQPIELLPSLEVFGIGSRRNLRLEILLWQRVGQLVADLQVLELFAVSQEIEYKNLHRITLCGARSAAGRDGRGGEKSFQPESGLLYRAGPAILDRSDE